LTKFPHRRTITFAARLAGYGQILDALREHKHFGITMAEDILYNNGKITTSNARMVAMKQELTPKQQAAFLKHDGMMSANVFDQFYKKVREKAKELQKKHKKKKDTGMSYSGSYTVGDRTFYVVKLDNMRVHIADGCWQIARISYSEGQNRMQYEFKEIRPNLFVASQGTARFYLDKEK
jgi:predicted transcriptional regulator